MIVFKGKLPCVIFPICIEDVVDILCTNKLFIPKDLQISWNHVVANWFLL